MLKKLRNKIINQNKVEPLTPERQKSLLISAIALGLLISLAVWTSGLGIFAKSIWVFAVIGISVSTAMYAATNHKLSDKQRQRWHNTNLFIASLLGFILVLIPKN